MPYISATEEIMYAPLDLRFALMVGSYLCPQFFPRIFRIQFLQFLPQLTGLQITRFRYYDLDLDNLVSATSVIGGRGHAFLAQTQLLSALRARRDAQLRAAVNGRYFNSGAERGFRRGHGDGHVDVVTLAAKHRMLADLHDDVEIARRPAIQSRIAFACDAYALAVARARLNADLERFGAHDHALTVACRTDALRLAGAVAAWALHVELHASAGLRDLSTAVALGTRSHSADRSFAAAIATGVLTRDVDAHYRAANRVPEPDIDLVLKIRPRFRMCADSSPGTASAKHAGENIAEAAATTAGALSASSAAAEIGKIKSAEIKWRALAAGTAAWRRSIAESARAKTSAPRVGLCGGRIDIVGLEAELIEYLALLGIAQNVIGFGEFFELFFSFFVV